MAQSQTSHLWVEHSSSAFIYVEIWKGIDYHHHILPPTSIGMHGFLITFHLDIVVIDTSERWGMIPRVDIVQEIFLNIYMLENETCESRSAIF